MTTERVIHQPGMVTRVIDRVKRPLFIVFFLAAMLGVFAGEILVFLGGTIGFCVVGLVHLLLRRSQTPLLGHYLGLGRYLRVTREGRVLLALTLVIGLAAVNARVNLLLIVLGVMLGVVLISGTLSETSLRKLSVKLFLPATAFAASPFAARLTLRNDKRGLPSYSLNLEIVFEGPSGMLSSKCYVLKVPARSVVTLEHPLIIGARGRHRVRRVRVGTRFPFGFFEKWSYCSVDAEVLMYPEIGRMAGRIIPSAEEYGRAGASKVLNKTGADEFWGIREFREGDNPRLIHWKCSARTRMKKRLVKEFHREEARKFCILLDAYVPPDAPGEMKERFEKAVSFAATLSKRLLEQDAQVSFAALGKGLVRLDAGSGQRQLRRILAALAEIEPNPVQDFNKLLLELDPHMRSHAFVFAVALDQARIDSTRQVLQRPRHNHIHIVSVDSPAFKLLFQPPAGGAS